MRSFLVLVFIVLISSLEAQTHEEKSGSIFGIGISFEKSYYFIYAEEVNSLPIGLGNIYMPINLSRDFRLEPEIGIFSYGYSYIGYKRKANEFRIGIGFHFSRNYASTKILFGVRLGIIYHSIKREYDNPEYEDDDYSAMDFYIGPTVGAEYFITKHFSLGTEAQLNYISIGEYDDDEDDENETRTIISTRALVLLRFYF